MSEKLDGASAWAMLAIFAVAAGVELDQRAHPDYKFEEDDTEEEDKRAKNHGESDVSDYTEIMAGLQAKRITVSAEGAMTVHWVKPPKGAGDTMVLDPELPGKDGEDDGWAYSEAICIMHTVPVAPAVSKRARARQSAGPGDDKIGRLYKFLEILAELPKGILRKLKHRTDTDLATSLAQFIMLE